MTAVADKPRVISTSLNFDNEWTPEEYLEVLYLRRANGEGDRISLDVSINLVEQHFAGRDPNDPSWLEYRELRVA